ncbi:MAG TPA: hypothetical protein ENJ01_02590 [Gammaproteobacteria bacterium]|nr:hypothetical protein [Gammaproteobacteria bacterium]
MSDAPDTVEIMVDLSGMPAPQDTAPASLQESMHASRKKVENYLEQKRLQSQIEDFLDNLRD